MPRILRSNLPRPLLAHLLARMRQRKLSWEQVVSLAEWLDGEPEVPEGEWFRRFAGFTVCGEGELIKTFLVAGQVARGKELL